jgi:hypothetical protein
MFFREVLVFFCFFPKGSFINTHIDAMSAQCLGKLGDWFSFKKKKKDNCLRPQ